MVRIEKAFAIACYAGAVLLIIDILRIGTVVGRRATIGGYVDVLHEAVINNITIQYLVIAGLIGLGSYFLIRK